VIVAMTRPVPSPAPELLSARHQLRLGFEDPPSREQLLGFVHGADAIVAFLSDRIDAELLDAAGPQLRVVSNYAVGYDNVDLAACAERGVRIGNTPDVLTGAVAELTWGLILAAARRVVAGDRFVRERAEVGWAPDAILGLELRGSTLGIVGAGRIGSEVARIGRDGFGMEVAYTSRSEKPGLGRRVELDELLRSADVVSIHVALAPETHHLIGARELGLMQRHAVLVNVARGPVVDEAALAAALRDGRIAGAGLDVYEFEPHPLPELLALENVALTPHVGSATEHTRAEMARLCAENALAALDGEPMPAEVRP
jgi:glyoxylate reductase